MFVRMHGLGNNFVIVDSRLLQWSYSRIASCVGYDQIIVVTNSSTADCFMHVYNVDGSRAENCVGISLVGISLKNKLLLTYQVLVEWEDDVFITGDVAFLE